MSRHRMIPALVTLVALVVPGSVGAQSAAGSGGTEARGSAKLVPQGVAASGTARADADAGVAADDALRKRIEARSAGIRAEDVERTEAKLAASARATDRAGETQGDARIAERLAVEFKTAPDAIVAEHRALDASWGELMIAHAIAANSRSDVTVASLVELRKSGMGWGRIAAGLGLRLGSVVSAVQTESRVVEGAMRADGRAETMRGPGARAGVGAGAGLHAGLANLHAGIGAGVKIR